MYQIMHSPIDLDLNLRYNSSSSASRRYDEVSQLPTWVLIEAEQAYTMTTNVLKCFGPQIGTTGTSIDRNRPTTTVTTRPSVAICKNSLQPRPGLRTRQSSVIRQGRALAPAPFRADSQHLPHLFTVCLSADVPPKAIYKPGHPHGRRF
jgi:hypothetical protein